MQAFRRLMHSLFWLTLVTFTIAALIFGLMVVHLQRTLPDVEVLKEMQLQVPLRIYSQDNQLIAEFGEKKRIPVPLQEIPRDLINAVLATEDARFYQHTGVDFVGLIRAGLRVMISGHAEQGGSTITMQVARNFFLTPKKTISRKIQEILLAIKIDRELSKEKILELYLNKIYFGNRAYGVAAASKVYFGKDLKELTLPEMALIAGLPKAPSTLNPLVNPGGAKNRRNHVLERMYTQGFIDQDTMEKAESAPIEASYHSLVNANIKAPYVAEMVRQALVDHYGEDVYTQGLQIYTTIDSHLQEAANTSLKQGLLSYDQRHGFQGPLKTLGNYSEDKHDKWLKKLRHIPIVEGAFPAAILSINSQGARLLLPDDRQIELSPSNLTWHGRPLTHMAPGWIIYISRNKQGLWQLTQLPNVEGSLVALNPNTGGILSLVGGYNFERSKFNRATQAERQPGSSFKPFIYAAALARGYHLATLINDAPIVVNTPGAPELWRPKNDQDDFLGPTRLRIGLVQSRNLISIRLLDAIGIEYALDYLKNFGFDPSKLPNTLSLALGTGTVTPLQHTAAFAILANGGYRVTPYVIDHIVDAHGRIIYKIDPAVACSNCTTTPEVKLAPRVISPQVAYLITSALQDVIQSGTATMARSLGRHDLAGKTGTTNEQKDAWFVGYNSDIVASAWVGYDQPASLHEYGNQAALPIWINFMQQALAGKPEHKMAKPEDVISALIDRTTGLRVSTSGPNTISEVFAKDALPPTEASGQSATFIDPDTGIDHTFVADDEGEGKTEKSENEAQYHQIDDSHALPPVEEPVVSFEATD